MNCIIAQSGGPTSVINSSVYGVVKENFNLKIYNNVYGGLNGIEGILEKKIINLSSMDLERLKTFKNSPSSGLGSCRYKLKDFNNTEDEYVKLMEILKNLKVSTFFYVGGNDSMDTTAKLSAYAKLKNIDIKFIGIPKTIDNDLKYTDHTPGFGSAGRFISTSVLESYLDSKVYSNNGIFILEAMGRDTGWLAATSALANINAKPCADLIYLPEVAFCKEKFLKDVRKLFEENNHVYIVASEGIRDAMGTFIAETESACHDNFGHAQLGGVASSLKNLIINDGITDRVKSLELGVLQRCAMHCSSKVDLFEAEMVGRDALNYSNHCESGLMVGIKRLDGEIYKSESFLIEAKKVANNVKYFPSHWINEESNGITQEALAYLSPLINDSNMAKDQTHLPTYDSFTI
ncbi:MAG: 6-phosphofructokinase [Sarcina sp.]